MDSLEAQGFDKAVKHLTQMGWKAVHAEPALHEVAAVFRREEARRWGKGWKPDAPATVARKGNDTVGVQTGALRDSLTVPGARYSIVRTKHDELVFGTRDPVANVFNAGRSSVPGKSKRRKRDAQPRRKTIRIYKKAREEAADILLQWVMRRVP